MEEQFAVFDFGGIRLEGPVFLPRRPAPDGLVRYGVFVDDNPPAVVLIVAHAAGTAGGGIGPALQGRYGGQRAGVIGFAAVKGDKFGPSLVPGKPGKYTVEVPHRGIAVVAGVRVQGRTHEPVIGSRGLGVGHGRALPQRGEVVDVDRYAHLGGKHAEGPGNAEIHRVGPGSPGEFIVPQGPGIQNLLKGNLIGGSVFNNGLPCAGFLPPPFHFAYMRIRGLGVFGRAGDPEFTPDSMALRFGQVMPG